jgi:hypothetical protein
MLNNNGSTGQKLHTHIQFNLNRKAYKLCTQNISLIGIKVKKLQSQCLFMLYVTNVPWHYTKLWETHMRKSMPAQLEFDISCCMFPQNKTELLIFTFDLWSKWPCASMFMKWDHYFVNVCWLQIEQMENCWRFPLTTY